MNTETNPRASAVFLTPAIEAHPRGAGTTLDLARDRAPVLRTVGVPPPRRAAPPTNGAMPEPPMLTRRGRPRAPLSSAQRRLWFIYQYDPTSPLYNLPLALRLKGKLVLRALQLAMDAIVTRHEALRTRFVSEDGEPVQVIDPPSPVPLRLVDLTGHERTEREAKLRELIAVHAHEPFDLSRDRLFRVIVARVAPEEHVLLIMAHHIVADGWSWHVLTKELAVHYKGFIAEWATSLPELPVQYADFAAWQNETLEGAHLEKLLAHWRHQLAGAPEFLDLPTDRPRPAVQTSRGGTVTINLSSALADGLKQTGQREGATLFMTLLASFQVLLSRYARQADVVVGAPIAGRGRVQLENLIGFFVNMLPMRANLADNPPFRELLRRVRATALEAYAHEDLPFDRLVEALRPERQAARSPLVQVAFVLQNTPGGDVRLPGLTVAPVDVWTDTAKLDLTLMVSENGHGLSATLEYSADIFERATAARMLGHWKTMLEAIVTDPAQRVGLLPMLTPPERRQILVDWNNTARDYPRDESIHELVAAQARRTPSAVAVEGKAGRLTYRELDTLANRLARRLQHLGVGADEGVAVCLERSPEMIVTWLAILKAGGAYVPVDPEYPAERRAFMLEDIGARIVITADKFRTLFAPPPDATGPTLLCVDADWDEVAREDAAPLEIAVAAQQLAYICYTSGSTGRPKGVCVPHRAVLRLLLGTDYFSLGSSDVVAQMANAAFDAATFEVWGPLLHGAKLVIVPTSVLLSPRELVAMIERHKLSTFFITTGAFNQLAQHVADIFRSAKLVMTGGEAANPACFQEVLQGGAPDRLLHVYGPTECTTFATSHLVREVAPDAVTIPIGRPIANTTAYVLNERRQLLPVGVPGELYLGGDGVARGYHRRPELTAEKFVADPFSSRPDARLYRTGDVVRWLPDGTLEFLGRTDNQVKVRGFRIEPGEIEATLARHEAVHECIVLTQRNGPDDVRLHAYVVLQTGAQADAGVLRDYLQAALPAYMVPSAIVILDAMPLNASGKVDRTALPAPDHSGAVRGREVIAPRTPLERELLDTFQSVLGSEDFGIHQGFFELGGHSLLAVRLAAQLEKVLERRVPVAAIFQAQSVAKLAQWLNSSKRGEAGDAFLTLQPHGSRLPLFLVHGVGGGMIWGYANLSRRLGPDQPVYVLRSRGLEGSPEPETIEALATQYVAELRAFQPEGPYQLGGYCFGGNVAYEMAVQLQAQGEEVRLLALFNSSPPNSRYDHIEWTPLGVCRFVANLRHVLAAIAAWEPERRRQFFEWKWRTFERRLRRLAGRPVKRRDGIDLEEMVDVSQYSEFERRVWSAHVNALMAHHTKPYTGPVTLFRSHGHCTFSSCDYHFGWNDYAPGAVRVVLVPGAHESILEEPHVGSLAAEVAGCLAEVHADRGGPRHQS